MDVYLFKAGSPQRKITRIRRKERKMKRRKLGISLLYKKRSSMETLNVEIEVLSIVLI
jgi:hypothetical protein